MSQSIESIPAATTDETGAQTEEGGAGPPGRVMRALRVCALVAGAAAFLLFAVTLTRTPPVWLDETVYASTAYSFVLNGSGVPTVVAENRGLLPWHLFYGPFYPSLGALLFETFGLSMVVFRCLSLFGALFLGVASGLLVYVVEREKTLGMVAFALISLTPELGSRATSGKMDPLVVALEIAGMVAFVWGAQQARGSRLGLAIVAASVAWSSAALASPRALLFFASMSLAVPTLVILGRAARRAVASYCAIGLVTAGVVTVWTVGESMDPLVWLHVIGLSSVGNTYDVSPLLGGAWAFRFSVLSATTPVMVGLVIALATSGGALAASSDGSVPRLAWRRFVASTFLAHAALTLATIGHPYDYGVYWALPLVPVALSLAWAILSRSSWRRPVAVAILVSIAALFGVSAGLRAAKTGEVFVNWQRRDPGAIDEFVAANVPAGSRVYGPHEYYFYAVEGSGSIYYFVEPIPHVNSRVDATVTHLVEKAQALNRPRAYAGTYLLWPSNDKLPPRFSCVGLQPLARYEFPAGASTEMMSALARAFPSVRTYPPVTLYLVPDECAEHGDMAERAGGNQRPPHER